MTNKLKDKINQFNQIKYPQDNSKRIIIATLESEIKKLEWGVTIASNSTK